MAAVADNVRVGVTGVVRFAPAGTAIPTTLAGAVDAAYKDVGYLSEDGITESISTDTNEIKAWQNGDIVRRVQTGHGVSYQLTMLETVEASLELFYGNFNDVSDSSTITGAQAFRGRWVIDVDDGADDLRIVIPDGQIVEKGDVTYSSGDPVSYPITIAAYPDATGVKVYKYFTDPTV